MTAETSICVVGAFPPPVHGMALINERVAEELRHGGGDVKLLDISPGSVSGWATLLTRWRRVAECLARFWGLLRSGSSRTLYVGLSGGWGQFYELLFVMLGRLYRCRILLHHHSFAYLDQTQLVTKIVFSMAGRDTCHVTLCPEMASKLTSRYPVCRRVRIISNAALIIPPTKVRARDKLLSIGYLSNVMRSKGIFEFLDVVDALSKRGVRVKGYIAGPMFEANLGKIIEQRCAQNPHLHYVGPVYGHAKEDFLRTIDVLLFPTTYRNEAEPLALWEALAHGVPVLAWGRGCIPTMLRDSGSQAIPVNVQFVESAVEILLQWLGQGPLFASASRQARERFDARRKIAQQDLRSLCDDVMRTTRER